MHRVELNDLNRPLYDDCVADPGDEQEVYEFYEFHGALAGDAPNAALQVLWVPAIGRAGILYTGSGSDGRTWWTDCRGPLEALHRYRDDEMTG